MSKTWLAKALAPYATWIDKKVTFAAKVGAQLTLKIAVIAATGMILGALGPAGLLAGAFLLGFGIGSSYGQNQIAAATAAHPTGASPFIAAMLSPIGFSSIWETVTGRGYFDDHALSDDELASTASDSLISIGALAFGGARLASAWGRARQFQSTMSK